MLILLESGARTDVTNNLGQTPLGIAHSATYKDKDILELLEDVDTPFRVEFDKSADLFLCDLNALREEAKTRGVPTLGIFEKDYQVNDAFIVTGDLVADTFVDHELAFTVVGNNVDVKAINTTGGIHVVGDVRATQFIAGFYNDEMMSAKTFKTPLLMANDYIFQGEFDVKHLFERSFSAKDGRLKKLLVDRVFIANELSFSKMIEVVVAGDSVFR